MNPLKQGDKPKGKKYRVPKQFTIDSIVELLNYCDKAGGQLIFTDNKGKDCYKLIKL